MDFDGDNCRSTRVKETIKNLPFQLIELLKNYKVDSKAYPKNPNAGIEGDLPPVFLKKKLWRGTLNLIKSALETIFGIESKKSNTLIKHRFYAIIEFFRDIVGWFRHPKRLIRLQNNRNLIAVAIKGKYDSGNYMITNLLFDKEANTIDQSDAIIMESENIDSETRQKFSDKDMIILQ